MNKLNLFVRGRPLSNIFVFIVAFFVSIFFLRHALFSGRTFGLYMDNEFLLGPILSSMSHSFSNGEWPLRMETILGGVSLYNLSQLSPFYPFYFSILPIFENPIEAAYSLHWLILIHVLIFEINLYVFLRVIGVGRVAGVVGAALIAFGANSLSYAGWINITAPYAWLPLYMAGLIGILNSSRTIYFSCIALVGIVLLTLASPSQPLIHAVLLSAVFVSVWLAERFVARGATKAWRSVLVLLGVGILAFLLVAPVLLPAAFDFANMIRWIGPFPAVIGHNRIPFEAFQIGQLSIADLAGVLFRTKDALVGSQFVGLVTLALAVVALTNRARSWIVISLGFIAIYSLVSSTGANLGLAYLNYHIPGLNKIREPCRFLVLFQFAIGALAAIGLDEIAKTVSGTDLRGKKVRQTIVLLGVTVIGFAVCWFVLQPKYAAMYRYKVISLSTLIVLVGLTTYFAFSKVRIPALAISATWGVAALALLAIQVQWIPSNVADGDYLGKGLLTLDMVFEKVNLRDPRHEYRVVFEGNIDRQRAAMLASYRGIRTFNSYFNPAPYKQFNDLYYHGKREDNYFQILGAKYLICDICSTEATRGYHSVERVSGFSIYETDDVLPHYFVGTRIDGFYNSLGEFAARAAGADLKQKLLFVESGGLPEAVVHDGFSGNCVNREDVDKPNRHQYTVQCDVGGILVLNEYRDLAWKVYVDGVRKPLLAVNGTQMGVIIPSGGHLVEFRYLPGIFFRSLAIGVLGVCLVILVAVYLRLKRSGVVRELEISVQDMPGNVLP